MTTTTAPTSTAPTPGQRYWANVSKRGRGTLLIHGATKGVILNPTRLEPVATLFTTREAAETYWAALPADVLGKHSDLSEVTFTGDPDNLFTENSRTIRPCPNPEPWDEDNLRIEGVVCICGCTI